MVIGFPILEITDGTTTIDLLSRDGLRLENWEPRAQAYKYMRNESSLAHGSAVVLEKEDNVLEDFALFARGADEDILYANIGDLLRLLRQAVEYWTSSWASAPVYLKARGPRETNTRYAMLYSYNFPGMPAPNAQTIFSALCTPFAKVALQLERGPWQHVAIGSDEAIQASGMLDTFGQEATTANSVFIANKSNLAQLTHIYRYTAAGGIFSPNQIGKPVMALLTTPPANDDCCYFGIETAVANQGPFSNLVFDIGTAAVYTGNAKVIWEYYDGAAWSPLTVADDTVAVGAAYSYGAGGGTPWQRTGVNSVRWGWDQPGGGYDWSTVAINGVTAWWVRARAIIPVPPGDSITQPSTQNRAVYTTIWARAAIAAAQVLGDLPLRARIRIDGAPGSSRYILGLRSAERDFDATYPFKAYINFSDTQQAAGITLSLGGGCAYQGGSGTINESITGRWIRATVGAGSSQLVGIAFNSEMAYSYTGKFHVYLRYTDDPTAAGGFLMRARLLINFTYSYNVWQGDWHGLYYQSAGCDAEPFIADLGVLQFPLTTPPKRSGRFTNSVYLLVEIYNTTTGALDCDMLDLVLIPCDEWIGDFCSNIADVSDDIGMTEQLDIDSATMPYSPIEAHNRYDNDRGAGGAYLLFDKSTWTAASSEPAFWQANKAQNLWFLGMDLYAANSPYWLSFSSYDLIRVQFRGVRRYILARGSR